MAINRCLGNTSGLPCPHLHIWLCRAVASPSWHKEIKAQGSKISYPKSAHKKPGLPVRTSVPAEIWWSLSVSDWVGSLCRVGLIYLCVPGYSVNVLKWNELQWKFFRSGWLDLTHNTHIQTHTLHTETQRERHTHIHYTQTCTHKHTETHTYTVHIERDTHTLQTHTDMYNTTNRHTERDTHTYTTHRHIPHTQTLHTKTHYTQRDTHTPYTHRHIHYTHTETHT